MDIFVANIPLSLSEPDVTDLFASYLHSPDFTRIWPGPPVNFKVTLHRDKKDTSHPHRGTGILTLPDDTLGAQLLDYYGGRLKAEHGLRISPSRKPIKTALDPLKKTPFQHPEVRRAREELERVLSSTVPAARLQFGWMDRDGVFSIEWERHYHVSPRPLEQQSRLYAHLGFRVDTREVYLEETSLLLEPPHTPRITAFKIPSIERVMTSHSDDSLILTLHHPPTFEEKSRDTTNVQAGSTRQRRTRHSCLDDPDHAKLVQYISLALRISFSDREHTEIFLEMSRVAKLPSTRRMRAKPERRGHFAPEKRTKVDKWTKRFDWPLAFQCAAMLSDSTVSAKEWTLYCYPRIKSLVKLRGSDATAEAVRQWGVVLRQARFQILAPVKGLELDERVEKYLERTLAKAINEVDLAASILRANPASDSVTLCYHATVTPTGLVLSGPSPEQSNRVLRRYKNHQHCFLRVNFTDEEKLQYRWNWDVDGWGFIKERVGGTLKRKLKIAGREFEFLAYSLSSLDNHAVWFVTPFSDPNYGADCVDANLIRSKLGNFDAVSQYPARYAARMSQAFSATDPTVTLATHEIHHIPDIERRDARGKVVCTFTDGVGTMSCDVAERIGQALAQHRGQKGGLKNDASPSHCAFHMRIGGSKGVLSLDRELQGSVICLRPSMEKFDAPDSLELEVATTFERPGPMYLHRPLIMLLETLGVPQETFVNLQLSATEGIQQAAQSLEGCAELMQNYGLGTAFRVPSVLTNLFKLGMRMPSQDTFFARGINYATNHALRGIKYKARIPVPDSYTLVGVADVHNVLDEGQIYVCLRDTNRWSEGRYLEGLALITHSPISHPGDVQIVTIIGRPPEWASLTLGKLFNVVVFPSKGERSLCQSLAGGDLDGDLYNVIMYKDLYPSPDRIVEPASYPKVKPKKLPDDRICTIDDVADFIVDFIQNDTIGLISSRSLIIADQCGELMMRHPDCLDLAELATQAVDFKKSGHPASVKDMPKQHYQEKPDWSAGEVDPHNHINFYQSTNALGVLFRNIELRDVLSIDRDEDVENDLVKALRAFDPSKVDNLAQDAADEVSSRIARQAEWWIPLNGNAGIAEKDVLPQFRVFAAQLQYICANCSLSSRRPLREEEAWAGTIAAKSSQPHIRNDMQARLREQCGTLVKFTRAGLASKEGEELEMWLRRAWTAWLVSRCLGKTFGARSYGYTALGSMFEVLEELEKRGSQHAE